MEEQVLAVAPVDQDFIASKVVVFASRYARQPYSSLPKARRDALLSCGQTAASAASIEAMDQRLTPGKTYALIVAAIDEAIRKAVTNG